MGSALPVGSLAIVSPQTEYQVGEIVTFKIPGSEELLTHRIESVKVSKYQSVKVSRCQSVKAETTCGVRVYETQGDANNVADDWQLTNTDIVGKVVFHLPYLGYLFRLPQILVRAIF